MSPSVLTRPLRSAVGNQIRCSLQDRREVQRLLLGMRYASVGARLHTCHPGSLTDVARDIVGRPSCSGGAGALPASGFGQQLVPAVRPLSHLTSTPECRGPGGRLRFAARANIAERLNGYREKLVEKGQDPVSFRCTMV